MEQETFWLLTGSQELYGPEVLEQVTQHASVIAEHLSHSSLVPFKVVPKPVLTTSEAVFRQVSEANQDETCAGVLTWMHTFSPAKLWIRALKVLQKPVLHFHTQFHVGIPWDTIDMDFMNMNQSAHGDKEYGFIGTRLGLSRKVVVGHWTEEAVQNRIADWMRTAAAFRESQALKVARFGDSMRGVADSEGDRLEAQVKFGWTIDGFGVGDLVTCIREVSDREISDLTNEYIQNYEISSKLRESSQAWDSVRGQVRIEIGLRKFLEDSGYQAFTTTFEELHGLEQLPGLAVQRLMAAGYGFAAEGDWKTAALLRVMKVMASYRGTSFMEDYTYHLESGNEMVLGAHMLEVCPSIAADRPRLEVHPLAIGGKADPARLVFDGMSGPAVCASLVDLGSRFRLVVAEVDAVEPYSDMPQLPMARALWKPRPNFRDAMEAWIYAGGSHHSVFSYYVTTEQLIDFAEMAGIECVVIDASTNPLSLRKEMRYGEMYWHMHGWSR